MSVGIISQVRVGSTRLPGKVLLPVLGRPILFHLLDRLFDIRNADQVILAIPDGPENDPLERLALRHGARVTRGSERDVLGRHVQAAREHGVDVLVRIPSDEPLIDPEVAGDTIAFFLDGEFDYVSNGQPPEVPAGMETEVIAFAALERANLEVRDPDFREHVTPYLWDQPDRFRVGVYVPAASGALEGDRWSLDYPEDFEFVKAVYERLGPRFGWHDVLRLLDREPSLRQINQMHSGVTYRRFFEGRLRTIP